MTKPVYVFEVREDDEKAGNFNNYYFIDAHKAADKFEELAHQAKLNGKEEGNWYSLALYTTPYDIFLDDNEDFINDCLESNDTRYIETDLLDAIKEILEVE